MQSIKTSEWFQLKYGKRVAEENGPIVKGDEHKVTGVSNSIPESFKTVMVPSVLGIGNNDRTNWREFTWHETGGMTIQTRQIEGQHYVIGGKIIGRSESGSALGRMYTEAHYACIPISEHQFPSVLGLYQALHTAPQIVDHPFELPILQVERVSVDLEDNWLEFVAPVLRILLSGLPLSIKTTRREMEEMVEFVHIVQSCLPNTLAWRLTSKIGALECPPGEAVLSFVEASNYEVPRMIGFSNTKPEKNIEKLKDIIGGEPYPDVDDTLIGERYIEYLQQHCAQCENTLQLQEQIQTDFPKLQRWDYFAASKSLEDAGVEFLQVLFEDDALAQLRVALDEGGHFPSLNRFYHRKKEALSLLLEHIWAHPTVVLKSLTQWNSVWQEVSKECSQELSCIMDLLMSNRRFSAGSFQPLLGDIPKPFHQTILRNLDRWIDQLHRLDSTDDTVFPTFLALHEELPAWITDWIADRQQTFALMLRYSYRITNPQAFLPFGIWLSSLSQEALVAVHQEDTLDVKRTLKEQPNHIVHALIEELYTHSPLIVIQWVLDLGIRSSTGTSSSRLNQIQNWEGLLKSVWTANSHTLLEEFKTLGCNPAYSSKFLERLLAEVFTTLPTNDQDLFWPLLSPHVGQTIARYRFGRESNDTNGKFDSLFIADFAELYRNGHAALQNIFVDVAEANATLSRRHEIIAVCKQVFKHREHTHPLPKTLRDIKAGQFRSIAGIKPEWIQFWCAKLDLTIELSSIQDKDPLCRFFFELNPTPQEPSYRLLNRLLTAKESALPIWTDWEHDLQQAQWHDKSGWRLLFIESSSEKALQNLDGNAETIFLRMSNLEMKAKLIRLGFLVEPSYFDSLTIEQFGELSPESQSILVWYGLHFAEEKLGETVVRGWILAMSQKDRIALRSELSSAFSMFSSLVQQVSDYFEETPTTLPQQMTPTEWVKEYLLTLPKRETSQPAR